MSVASSPMRFAVLAACILGTATSAFSGSCRPRDTCRIDKRASGLSLLQLRSNHSFDDSAAVLELRSDHTFAEASAALPPFLVPVLKNVAVKLLVAAAKKGLMHAATMSLPGDTVAIINLDHTGPSRAFVNSNDWARWPDHVKVDYGQVVLLNVHDDDNVQIFEHIARTEVWGSGGEGSGVFLYYEYASGPTLCAGERVMPGHTYVYAGGGCSGLKTTRNFNWQGEHMIQEYCSGESVDQVEECVKYLGCAMEELYWFETSKFPRLTRPSSSGPEDAGYYGRGSTYLIPARSQCALLNGESEDEDAWKRRDGLQHNRMQCHSAPDGWCGNDGLCCRYPGVWPAFNGDYYAGGCKWKGCHYRHCCVAK